VACVCRALEAAKAFVKLKTSAFNAVSSFCIWASWPARADGALALGVKVSTPRKPARGPGVVLAGTGAPGAVTPPPTTRGLHRKDDTLMA
jgi:hypothetical protein